MRWLLLPPPSLLALPRTTASGTSGSSSGGESWESKRGVLLATSASVLCASAAFAIYQLTKILFAVVRDSEHEVDKLITTVSATIHSDSPDVVVPGELVIYDDIEDVYTYGSMQELFYRRSTGAETDWEWSFDMDEWYSTADLAPPHSFILDPPSLIFIARLHLTSVARRKIAATTGRGSGNSSSNSQKQPSRIPPPVELPAWAQQQQGEQLAAFGHAGGSSRNGNSSSSSTEECSSREQPHQGSDDSSSSSSLPGGGGCGERGRWSSGAVGASAGARRLEDAPESLCCPITGQIMLQPVTLPSGKTFEYEAVRRWITQHGTDPTTCEPVSILDLHPNLLLREMVEKWLAGTDPLADPVPEP